MIGSLTGRFGGIKVVDWNVLMDKFPDGVFTLGEAATIEFCNDSIARLTGHTTDHLTGAPMNALVPKGATCRADGKELGLAEYLIDLTRIGPEIASRDALHCVAPILHKSGVEIEVGWLILGVRTGERTRAVISIHGLEEAIPPSDHALPPDEDVHQIIFDNAPIGIFYYDHRGVITACNDLFVGMIGSSRFHLVGLDTRTINNPQMIEAINESLAGRRGSFRGDYSSATADKVTPVAADFAPVFGTDGKIVGGVGLIQDVTEHRTKERLLARTERLASLGTLAAGMVHEIQNPLAFAVTSLDVASRLIDGTLDSARLQELRATIRSAREGALRVSSIARDLKTFARADDEKRTSVDVEAAIDSALQLVRPQLKARARLVKHYGGVPRIAGNEHRLVQLFVNLLVNSVEAVVEGDTEQNQIVVSTTIERPNDSRDKGPTEAQTRVRIEIEDTGKGMSAHEVGHVFEPFWTNKPNGMGLGLAICHGIVTGLGGEIFHEQGGTADEPRGTRTVVILPASASLTSLARTVLVANKEPVAPPSVDSDSASKLSDRGSMTASSSVVDDDPGTDSKASGKPARRAKVLVIDDEERLAATIRIALMPLHDVEIATSGRQALTKLKSGTYDVVLCDLFLPDISGPDIFDEMARTAPAVAERFVFLTGGAFTDRARSFLQDVPNPRLEKPFDLVELEDLIAALLNGV